ncbi:unnamed protein product [Mytilus coruscus]|uniref:Uncharacterized protein n=1 Tax=Mytilus coruscus TaxID=42192 RepID=A0A6J8AEB7_MYTCO|nr:unnamed protein product [Mytilus coruscus]
MALNKVTTQDKQKIRTTTKLKTGGSTRYLVVRTDRTSGPLNSKLVDLSDIWCSGPTLEPPLHSKLVDLPDIWCSGLTGYQDPSTPKLVDLPDIWWSGQTGPPLHSKLVHIPDIWTETSGPPLHKMDLPDIWWSGQDHHYTLKDISDRTTGHQDHHNTLNWWTYLIFSDQDGQRIRITNTLKTGGPI